MEEPSQEPRMEFDEYVTARGRALERYAFVLTGDAQLAEDLVQTALAKAYRRWRRVVAADRPDLYVRRIVTSTFIDWTRRRRPAEHLVDEVPEPGSNPGDDPADRVAARDELVRGLSTLTPRQRAVLVLRHVEGYDDALIAATLGCSETTVRSHASRGLDALRAFLGHQREIGETR